MRFAARMNHIGTSGIRDFFDKGKRIRDSIDLSIGMADFDVPEPIKEATIRAIHSGCGKYSVTQGHPEVVAATREFARTHFGIGEDEEVMLTVGACGAITNALLALAGPGDEVLLPDPFFVIYRNLVHIAGATPVLYDLYPDFQLRPEAVAERLTDRTRVVILNSPSNPTGVAFQAAAVEAVARLCRERDIPVLSDELYHTFCYDEPHVSIKQFSGKETLLVGGFSKAYGMAGWRLGWAAGDPELIDRMRTLQQFNYTCPPTLVQLGALAAFDVDMTPQVDAYRRKRDLIHDGLVQAGFEVSRPGGSFFVFPKVPWGDDLEFCNRALDEKVIIVPGRAFSSRTTHFRISFATSDETLERGVEALARVAAAG
jgi:aspartate aminotransferase/aminotransferase